MTRPAEIRTKEDAARGTAYDAYAVGERVGPVRFDLEPAFIDEYIAAVGLDAGLYAVGGRPAAPPQILALYLMATLHERYPPLPGALMAELAVELHRPIWRDEVTRIVSQGVIEKKAERRGRRFLTWSAEYRRAGGLAPGPLLARITNTFVVPR